MAEATKKRERTCIGCGAKAGKAQLHRIVRCEDGSVRYDSSGRAAGRGAYVCSKSCFDAVNGTNRLQRALRVSLSAEDAEQVANDIEAACAAQAS